MSEPIIQQRLAAVLAADVAGYSRLMEVDEHATVAALDEASAVFREHIEAQRGRVVDMAGDSVLAIFETAAGAVEAAIAIQEHLAPWYAEQAADRRMLFRLGINSGDIIEKADGTIYGDGVNVAARIESLAEPGGVAVSGSIHDNIEGKLGVGFVNFGEHMVKNISKPVRVYHIGSTASGDAMPTGKPTRAPWRPGLALAAAMILVVVAGVVLWQANRAGGPDSRVTESPVELPTGPSIAVLPFENMSDDPAQEYFADGLTEDIITALSRFHDLSVIARQSTFQFKGKATDVREIGRALNAQYVLEGSVRKIGNRVRITMQLIDSADGNHIWAENYDRELTDIFAVQDEITNRVVGTLADSTGQISAARLSSIVDTENLDAYDHVLAARQWLFEISPETHAQARDALERAVALDPGYSHAYARLSYMYLAEVIYGYNPLPDPLKRAYEAATKAVELDRSNAYAHYMLATYYFFVGELELFRIERDKSVNLNPNDAEALAFLGMNSAFSGEWELGAAMARKSIVLNPNGPSWYHVTLTWYHYMKDEYDEALSEAEKALRPNFIWSYIRLAACYAQLGMTNQAQEAAAKVLELDPEFSDHIYDEFRKWRGEPNFNKRIVEGLRLAGLDIPDETPPATN